MQNAASFYVHKGFANVILPLKISHKTTRVIQKISSVCEYCLCSAVVTMVHIGAKFVDSVARHGRNFQTFEQCLRIVLCVYNV